MSMRLKVSKMVCGLGITSLGAISAMAILGANHRTLPPCSDYTFVKELNHIYTTDSAKSFGPNACLTGGSGYQWYIHDLDEYTDGMTYYFGDLSPTTPPGDSTGGCGLRSNLTQATCQQGE